MVEPRTIPRPEARLNHCCVEVIMLRSTSALISDVLLGPLNAATTPVAKLMATKNQSGGASFMQVANKIKLKKIYDPWHILKRMCLLILSLAIPPMRTNNDWGIAKPRVISEIPSAP